MASKLTVLALKTAKTIHGGICSQGATKVILRPMSASSHVPVKESIKNSQELFQLDDSKPIFLKGGTLDSVLYRFTMGLCVVALALIGKNIYTMALPKKQ